MLQVDTSQGRCGVGHRLVCRGCTASLPRSPPAVHMPTDRVNMTPGLPAQVEEDPTGGKFSAAGGTLNSAPHKLEDAVHFHVGDIVKALGRAALQPGGQEALLYGTLGGAIGAPPATCAVLEMHLAMLCL
jgi:hypothetical protein